MWPLDAVWTFRPDDERLQLRIAHTDEGLFLVEHNEDLPTRSFFFTEAQSLIEFQKDRIAQLQDSGWTLVGFAPDRRSGVDRRQSHKRGGAGRRGSFHPRPS